MRRNLIYGSICLAALSCFAVLAVAQQRPAAPQQPAATPQPAPAQQPAAAPGVAPQNVPAPQNVTAQEPRPTHYIEMPPGFTIRFESPRPFASVVAGNIEVAEAVPGQSDRILVVTSKPVIGATNFLMIDRNGQEVANLLVNVKYPPAAREVGKVAIHNKKDNLAGFTNYICNPICVRVNDDLEGEDRVPPAQNLNQTFITTPSPAPTIPYWGIY